VRWAAPLLIVAACTRTPAPVEPSERALFRDLERHVTIAETTGWGVDRIQIDKMMEGVLDSVCRVGELDRRGLRSWLDEEIVRRGGPIEAAWRARGKELRAVDDLLVLHRVRAVLIRADQLTVDCPFWLEPEVPFRGRQISEQRWQLSFGGGGKGIAVVQGENRDLRFGGAGRLLLGRMLEGGDGIYAGVEVGASAAFPKDATGERTSLELGLDLVTPIVYRRTRTNAYFEIEAGWLGKLSERSWSDVDHGIHVGVAVGARALRTRFLFPGAAFGLSYERTFVAGEDLHTIKLGGRVAFDLDL
jgi:hypothetical protein